MAKRPERVVWDACTFIAHIKQEKALTTVPGVFEDRGKLCAEVLRHAKAGDLEIVTSTLALAEVRKAGSHPDGDTGEKIARFFDQAFILVQPLDHAIGHEARRLGLAHRLSPQDAVYLATAAVLDIPTLHGFDDDVLAADGKAMTLRGRPILVCKPRPPMLGAMSLFRDPILGSWSDPRED